MNTVLITGTSRGIGKELMLAFANRGDDVTGYRRGELGDIRDVTTIAKLKTMVESRGVNILVNNAGVYSDKWMKDANLGEIKEIIDVNLIAPMMLTRAIWPTLVARQGTVININSVAGRVPAGGEIAYRTSKFGLAGFSASLAYEGQRDGVRVIDIPLGGVNTDMLKHRPGMDANPLQQPAEAARLILQIFDSPNSKQIKHLLLQGNIIDTRCTNGRS